MMNKGAINPVTEDNALPILTDMLETRFLEELVYKASIESGGMYKTVNVMVQTRMATKMVKD